MAFKMKSFEQISYSMINWMNNTVNTLTDFSVGSKIRTILETVALEMEQLYLRSYTSVTEAQAEGVYEAFDFTRKSASRSTGIVTVSRDTGDLSADHTIGTGVYFQTEGTDTVRSVMFETYESKTILTATSATDTLVFPSTTGIVYTPVSARFIEVVLSIQSGSVTYTPDDDYILFKGPMDRDMIEWIDNIANPTALRPANGAQYIVTYRPLSVDIGVTCLDTGIVGNVAANKIVKISQGGDNISNVNNFYSFVNGADTESDADRKIRFANFIAGLSRGTIASIRYAIFNKMVNYTVYSATILENQPTPGFIKIYVSDSSGTASDAMVAEVRNVVEDYRGVGITAVVASPTIVTIDVYCKLRIRSGYNKVLIASQVNDAITTHLGGYKLLDDDGYSTVYLSTLDYVVKNVNSEAIIEADISFKRTSGVWLSEDPIAIKLIEDIAPELSSTQAEIFNHGIITVDYWV